MMVFFVVQSLQHILEDGQAFPPAGGIEMQVLADFSYRGLSPPELSDADGAEMVGEGVLKEFWCTAFTAAGGRGGGGGALEDLEQVLGLSEGIAHHEVLKQPSLEGIRHLFPLGAKAFDFFFEAIHGRLLGGDGLLVVLPLSLEFGFHPLAFPDQFFFLARRVLPPLVSLPLGLFHLGFPGGDFLFHVLT